MPLNPWKGASPYKLVVSSKAGEIRAAGLSVVAPLPLGSRSTVPWGSVRPMTRGLLYADITGKYASLLRSRSTVLRLSITGSGISGTRPSPHNCAGSCGILSDFLCMLSAVKNMSLQRMSVFELRMIKLTALVVLHPNGLHDATCDS
jgi:hypothetical protein